MGSYPHFTLAANRPAEGWAGVIASTQKGQIDQLYRFFYPSLLRFYVCRGYSQDAADLAMNAVMSAARSIRRGEIKDPDRLPGYMRSVARRCLAATIEDTVRSRTRECEMTPHLADQGQTPEELAIEKQQSAIITKALATIPRQESELLIRFYRHGQTKEEICDQMQLTDDKFRNMKSRAKLRVTSVVQSLVSKGPGTLLKSK